MEKAEFNVKIVESSLVPPCLPSPRETLYLSNLDNQPAVRMGIYTLFVYEGCENGSANPAKTIREALAKALVYYYPLAGRLRKKEDGKLQLECTGEGVLFVEAMVDNTLSVIGDLVQIKQSFKQLIFRFPFNTTIEDVHPIVLQANRFIDGGFVIGVSLNHMVCDGRGAAKFLKDLGEMARGHVKPLIEPIWERELLKPRKSLVQDFQLIEGKIESTPYSSNLPIHEESIQMPFIFDVETIKYMKQRIMEECMDIYTTFEIVAALVWQARTKALQISHTQSAKFFFAIDVRESFNPPLPNGYYGNGFVFACAEATVHDIINQPLSYIINIIKKTKMSVNDEYLRSTIDMDQFPLDIYSNQSNMLLTDWRWLGLNEVYFGHGNPVNICPLHWNENGINISNAFFFLHCPKGNVDKYKMITWMSVQKFRLFKMEAEAILNKYMATSMTQLKNLEG